MAERGTVERFDRRSRRGTVRGINGEVFPFTMSEARILEVDPKNILRWVSSHTVTFPNVGDRIVFNSSKHRSPHVTDWVTEDVFAQAGDLLQHNRQNH